MSTEITSVKMQGGKFVVTASGGYDGYLKKEFDSVEEALDFTAYLWGLGTASEFYPKLRRSR